MAERRVSREAPTNDFAEAIRRFEAGLIINKDALDEELQANEATFGEVSSAYALARSVRDHLKQRVKEEEAHAASDFRETARTEKEKFTVDEVKEAVTLDNTVKALHASLIEAEYHCNVLDGFVEAYKSRGSNIRKLADLHMTGYYNAGQSIGGVSRKVTSSLARQADDALRRQHEENKPDRRTRR